MKFLLIPLHNLANPNCSQSISSDGHAHVTATDLPFTIIVQYRECKRRRSSWSRLGDDHQNQRYGQLNSQNSRLSSRQIRMSSSFQSSSYHKDTCLAVHVTQFHSIWVTHNDMRRICGHCRFKGEWGKWLQTEKAPIREPEEISSWWPGEWWRWTHVSV